MRKLKAILVHGTFARETQWDDPDSRFTTELRRLIGARDAQVDVDAFHWSGDNSHQARRKAAEELAAKLEREGRGDYDEVFIVAHSHGGTVTRLALHLLQSEERPTAVFTFGSPFVRFRPRMIAAITQVVMWLARVMIAIGVLLFGGWLLGVGLVGDPVGDVLLALVACIALGYLFVVRYPPRLEARVRGGLIDTQTFLTTTYDPPAPRDTPFLCFHAVADEAGLLLRFWSFFTWVLHTLIYTLLNGAFFLLVIAAGALGLGLIVKIGLVPEAIFIQLMTPLIEWLRATLDYTGRMPVADVIAYLPGATILASFIIMLALFVMAIIAAPFAFVLPWLTRSQWFAFGGERFSWSFASEIHIDRLPNHVSELRWRFFPKAFLKGSTQHNYYYFVDEIVEEIADRMVAWRALKPSRFVSFERALGKLTTFAFLLAVILCLAPLSHYLAEFFAYDIEAIERAQDEALRGGAGDDVQHTAPDGEASE